MDERERREAPDEIRVPKSAVYFLTGLLMLILAPALVSENVTLTTYYPAPSGVYTQMITTADTYLSRDSGKTILGTTAPTGTVIATEKLVVNGDIRLNGASATYRIANVANPVDAQDVATRAYVLSQSGGGGTPSTWTCTWRQGWMNTFGMAFCQGNEKLITGGCANNIGKSNWSSNGPTSGNAWFCQLADGTGPVYANVQCCM